MSLLSSDVLHKVLEFFVSPNQIVDGESLRVASLVCKRWRDVADSRSLWATSLGETDCHMDSDDHHEDSHSHTIHQSLHIKEQIRDPYSYENTLQASLIGFVNLEYFGTGSSELYFFVRERATGSKLLLSISRDGQKSPSLLRDIYANHFESKGDFHLRDNNNKSINFFPSRRFSLGISVWKGRVVRWYRSGNETEARETINLISTNRDIQLHQDLPFTQREKQFSLVRHLIDLENISGRKMNDMTLYVEGRHHIVDWVSGSNKHFHFNSPL